MRVRLVLLGVVALSIGCGSHARRLVAASEDLGKSIRRGDREDIEARVLPGSRARVDYDALLAEETESVARDRGAESGDPETKSAARGRGSQWGQRLARPTGARPEAIIHLANDEVIEAVWTDKGWRFAGDPTLYFGQATPRDALRSLVRASREGRWDVMLNLAPRRYRIGLSEEDLQKAWTEGPQADALQQARDRLAERLSGTIRADAHQAILDLGDGEFARLEREKDRWVVVDF